ncbi:uroporphyrinogen-III synthase [Palleronia marisminoris]|uniref:Uroporphyrinogen-III synthase n=2 Tax=Palleronia marisminoris TaxID=315423 RepID=A0A1Y5SY18_9RHOB|nr:uroporphyrinogen-III synthase [Palleronia marisminoris]SFH06884.1 uroporphyrinogen-III synthase [Palleronia marisminoris]SLN51576.1 uroporphyrinogen-III synthase [Palleronia marisminoris]
MIVLTRPLPAARRFARALRQLGMDAPILFSPVLEIVPLGGGPLPDGTLVFTSENGVAAASELGSLAGRTVITVGERTAAAARAAGAEAEVLGGDVAALGDAILARGGGPYVHLHGRHVTGDLAGRLQEAGIAAEGRAIYDQRAKPLTEAARSALMGPEPVVLPLFSARSASLTAAALDDRPVNLHVVALGPKVLDSWPWPMATLGADRTDMSAMADATVAAWRDARG